MIAINSRTWQIRTSSRQAVNLYEGMDGVAAIEFAVIAPVFLLLLMATLDLGHMAYAQSVLDGAVQSAARASTLETSDTTAADDMVEEIVSQVIPDATISSTRVSYYDFADIGRPEDWNDANDDGTCGPGEAFTDENRSGDWDDDVGSNGNGGANDVVVYTVSARYRPVFGMPFTPSQWADRTLRSTAVKKNQPFADQANYGSSAGVCS